MSAAHQNRSRYRLLIRRLKQLRFPLIALGVWLFVTGIAVFLYGVVSDLYLKPWLDGVHLNELELAKSQIIAQLPSDMSVDIPQHIQQHAKRLKVEVAFKSGEGYLSPLESDLLLSRRASVLIPLNLTDTQYSAVLYREYWPFYQRADLLGVIVISIFFYAPVLMLFIFFLELRFAYFSRQAMNQLESLYPSPVMSQKELDFSLLALKRASRYWLARVRRLLKREQKLRASAQSSLRITAHEMRRPLQKLSLALDIWGESVVLDERQRGLQSNIMQSIDEINQLVDESLWATRLQHGPLALNRTHFSFDQLIKEVLLTLPEQKRNQQISVQAGANTPENFFADRRLLERALLNLLGNALKYGGQQVQIGWQWSQQELILSVQDDGPGVADGFKQQIFKPFELGQQSTGQKVHGGLGLAIVKSIVDSHGGVVRATDSLLGGAAFVIRIPLQPMEAPE